NGQAALVVLGFGDSAATAEIDVPTGRWRLALDSDAAEFGGAGTAPAPRDVAAGRQVIAQGPHRALIYLR
ncbi:MAG: alpha amylase C-terminal domain-containing protein, partial [Candidatus Rokuibacteriota bacterium]